VHVLRRMGDVAQTMDREGVGQRVPT
jgi:hypothetical protein